MRFGMALSVLLLSTASSAWAAPSAPDSLSVALELTPSGSDAPVSLSVTLSGDRDCARIEDDRGPVHHRVEICREGGSNSQPVLSFDIDRSKSVSDSSEHQHFRFKAKLSAGEPQVLGHFGNGPNRLEVKAQLRAQDR